MLQSLLVATDFALFWTSVTLSICQTLPLMDAFYIRVAHLRDKQNLKITHGSANAFEVEVLLFYFQVAPTNLLQK